jgi:signal recognition particle subunit SRP54
MFKTLQQRLGQALDRLRGHARLTEDNIKDSLREVRLALLEADVALPIVRDFIEQIRVQATGQEVLRSLTPGQTVVKIVFKELVRIMGVANETLNLTVQPPAVILMAGLQGSGKTTSVAKLARWLKERHKKSIMVVSCDVYRPAAIAQLKTLAGEVNAVFFPSDTSQTPQNIASAALKEAKLSFMDVLLVDTAGRLHIDAEMMQEIKMLHEVLSPIETLFVVDAMTGQDAVNTAKAFHAALPLTGVILTKTDGDARGGAALSIRQITGKPIKFLGVGERTAALEPFHPERVASRILGMGDILSLAETIEAKVDRDAAEKLEQKLRRGKGFNLADFKMQLEEIAKIGGMSEFLEKMPGANKIMDPSKLQSTEKETKKMLAIINSMTLKERVFPDIIKGSRKRRIAAGSGTQVQDVNRLLKHFEQLTKVMKKMQGGKIKNVMRNLQQSFPKIGNLFGNSLF